jgi:hypothetical protein
VFVPQAIGGGHGEAEHDKDQVAADPGGAFLGKPAGQTPKQIACFGETGRSQSTAVVISIDH